MVTEIISAIAPWAVGVLALALVVFLGIRAAKKLGANSAEKKVLKNRAKMSEEKLHEKSRANLDSDEHDNFIDRL